jgi:hypothetical protein
LPSFKLNVKGKRLSQFCNVTIAYGLGTGKHGVKDSLG